MSAVRLTLRMKLLGVVAVSAMGLLALIVAGSLIDRRIKSDLEDIRDRYLPRIGLRPALTGELERLRRGLQDAAAAADIDLLEATRTQRRAFATRLDASRDALAPADADALDRALDDYYTAAYRVSNAMIEGSVEPDEIAAMQKRQQELAALVDRATAFDEAELAALFASAAAAQQTATRLRLAVSATCLLLVLALSLWISRGLLRRLGELTAGFVSFGSGDLEARIPVTADELGEVATRANEMAARLARLAAERDLVEWLTAGQAGLANELRGELEPEQAADRAVAYLARTLGAPVGALWYRTDAADERLHLLGRHGLAAGERLAAIAPGEGLIGQASLTSEPTVVADPEGRLQIQAGVAGGSPRSIVLLPLIRAGAVTGVLELGILEPWTERSAELLLATRDTVAISIEVALARAATRALLRETTDQATALERQHGVLEAQNVELAAARQTLEQKAAELAAASRYKSQFLANMSHELRTPLNAIIGFAELMHDGVVAPDSPEHQEFLGDILTSGRHLLQLINDVLDLAKVEAGKLEFRPEPIVLDSLVGEVLNILRTIAASKRIVVDVDVASGLDELVLDPARLKQVLYNYASNALKFTPEGGRVSIRAAASGAEHFRLEVEDNGVGIAPADVERLFVEFQQVGAGAKRRAGGTGLGLALTRRLVEAQGGTVGVESTLGEGSVFWAVLPRRAEVVEVESQTEAELEVAPINGAPAVLVIEDDPADQAQLAQALRRDGYAVEVAATGAQAIARCAERRFDAVTLDLLLPDMSGLEVLREIRRGENRDVPVLVITVVAERGAVAGFAVHDILPKPLDESAVLAALASADVRQRHKTILVVDDDPGALKLMSTTLASLGYEARCERDSERALAAARDGEPAAIVLDLLMPALDGFDFLDRLRSEPAGRQVPVIVWTHLDLDADQRSRLRSSAQAVVAKGHGGSAAVIAELEAFLPREAQEA